MGPQECILTASYKLIAELLSYPEDLNIAEIEATADELAPAIAANISADAAGLVQSFVQDLKSITPGEYIETLELAPKCPLYLGYWAFIDEGADSPQRRKFMADLLDIYRQFGLSLGGKELPDFLPVVIEFLWISLGRNHKNARTQVITKHAKPWLPSMITCLDNVGSPYAKLLKALDTIIEWDLQHNASSPAERASP